MVKRKFQLLLFMFSTLSTLTSCSVGVTPLKVEKWEICDPSENICKEIQNAESISRIDRFDLRKSTVMVLRAHVEEKSLNYGDWIYIGEVADTIHLTLNDQSILNLNDKDRPIYLRFLSLFAYVPKNQIKPNNILKFKVWDLNETLFGLRSKIGIGHFPNILIKAAFDFLMRTGSSLLSSVVLIFLSFCTLITFYFIRTKQLALLATYGICSSLYLISFSEIPRAFLSPIVLSGPLHFSLRLTQDLTLCTLLIGIMKTRKTKLNIYIFVTYAAAIASLWITFSKYQSYPPVQSVMFFCAPLVALPSLLGFALSRRLVDGHEKRASSRFFLIMALLQISDLLVFWQIYPGYFFVKWYIPIVFTFIFYILVRRVGFERSLESGKIKTGEQLQQLSHDIRSPMAAIKSATAELSLKSTDQSTIDLLRESITRIEGIFTPLLSSTRTDSKQHYELEDIEEELYSYASATEHRLKRTIHLRSKFRSKKGKLPFSKSELFRVIDNLLSNSDYVTAKNGVIHLDLTTNKKTLTLKVSDDGPGFHKDVLSNAGKRGLTHGKAEGTGLGLAYCVNLAESVNGKVIIRNRREGGAEVLISIPIT